MPLAATSPLVCILNEKDERPNARELRAISLFAIRHSGKTPTFTLIKSRHLPTGFAQDMGGFALHHFTKPIGLVTLTRYVAANLK